MTAGYVFTKAARDDLNEIWEFIVRDNLDAADQVLEELEAAARMLAEVPGMGRARPDLTDASVLFWRGAGSYFLVYRPETRPLEVVRVLHGSRDVVSMLRLRQD